MDLSDVGVDDSPNDMIDQIQPMNVSTDQASNNPEYMALNIELSHTVDERENSKWKPIGNESNENTENNPNHANYLYHSFRSEFVEDGNMKVTVRDLCQSSNNQNQIKVIYLFITFLSHSFFSYSIFLRFS